MEPDLFVLPVFDRFLLLSPLQGVTALLNRSAARKIQGAIVSAPYQDGWRPEVEEIVRTIRKTPITDPVSVSEDIQPTSLGLIASRPCQGICHHCGFHPEASARGSIDLSLCAQMIEWMGRTVKKQDRETLDVHLLGGEPLWAKEAVDFIVHKTRSVALDLNLRPQLEMATDGVMEEKRARWIGEYFQTVVLFLDGSRHGSGPSSEDKNRWIRTLATAHRLRDSSAELYLHCCVSNRNIDDLEEIGRSMYEEFQPAAIDLETAATTVESVSAGILAPDPYEFAYKYYRLNAALSRLGGKAIYSAAHIQGIRTTGCPVGRDTVMVAPDGLLSSCFLPKEHCRSREQDCTIGYVSDGKIHMQMEEVRRLRGLLYQKQRCRHCFCRWTCAGGCHVDQTYPDCSPDYTPFCIQTRIITATILLSRLGFDSWAERLVEDQEAMEHLAEQVSDRLEHTLL